MTGQLAFDLAPRAALRREDFFVSATNALALAAIERWQAWPGGKMLLAGPAGSGKSHLAQIWATASGAAVLPASALATADLMALVEAPALAVEDAEQVAGSAVHEAALFHLHNLATAQGRPVLITASAPPRDWGLLLADLASRLQATPLTRLLPPDDALLSAVLAKLFADRQIAVAPALIPYLVARMDRSIDAARALVAVLDARSLSQGRPITRALAASVLDSA